MKHAGNAALQRLEHLLTDLRSFPGLQERTSGVFYRKSKAFLHFHEDPLGLFADIRIGHEFERFPVNSPDEIECLLAVVRETTL